jgi:AraC-like DNA-binding protein
MARGILLFMVISFLVGLRSLSYLQVSSFQSKFGLTPLDELRRMMKGCLIRRVFISSCYSTHLVQSDPMFDPVT